MYRLQENNDSMDHVAIMKKSWGLLPKILAKEKKIETRWYKTKYPPWNRIKEGETIYFKNSGEPVTVKTEVHKVLQFSDLNSNKVWEILELYAKNDGIDQGDIPKFFKIFKNKKYCIIVFLKNPQKIRPFNIEKKGIGAMSSWISTNDLENLRKK